MMMPNTPTKRKSNATSPPSSKRSPMHSFSPPHTSATSPPPFGRPLTTAAAAVAAIKRSTSSNTIQNASQQGSMRRQSGSTAPPSRQGSVETDREGSVVNSVMADDEQNIKTEDGKDKDPKDADVDAEDDEKEDLVVDMDAHMAAQMEKAKEDMKVLLENFSEDQLQRYEGYRRSALNRTNVKRLVSQVLNQQCSQTMAFVVAGFSKVYVGEIVEKAKEIMEEWGDEGAIRPEHLREAHRRYKKARVVSSLGRKL